ncbi:CASZ1.2 family protein [Megaselia abdita]
MTSNMDFLMKLYLMNFVQQQQKSSTANNITNVIPPATSLADPTANITSTPTSSFDDSDYKSNISIQHGSNSTNTFSTPSSISSDDKSSILVDASSTLSPLSMSTPKNSEKHFSSNESSISNKSKKQDPKSTSCTSLQLFSNSSTDSLIQEENLKNLKKYSSFIDCKQEDCGKSGMREHFHCYEDPCSGKVLTKKEDIIRHLKWHKKRKESLNFGFLRFSSSDDCSQSYGPGCNYCWKQTHYHCVEDDCSKVYVSTSDVQMHANFHRKNIEIIQEGFQRYRAIEDCKTEYCPFSSKCISHYHCKRGDCKHTFKNKSDMDKHKTYHMKDEQLSQDGYKKILKTEICPFKNCKFSTVNNHIHCIRENCNYILHSSSQLISHKRKHDKQDSESLSSNSISEECMESERPPPNSISSTPVSTLPSRTSQFLSRKRGRPSKKIENNGKKLKMNTPPFDNFESPPFVFNNATCSSQHPPIPTPNVQLTHLMALFQLQNSMKTNYSNDG